MEAISVSVRKVIELVMRRGDIDSRYVDSSAMLEGAKAHRKIQRGMGPGYESEVTLKLDAVSGGIPVRLHGRADGVIHADGGFTIDEIKTSTLPLERLYEQREMFLAQAKCYAHMLMQTLEQPPEAATIQLTLFQLDTGELQRHSWDYPRDELAEFFHGLMERYGVWLRYEVEWRAARDASLRELAFPFHAYRAGQRELAVGVYRSIQQGRKLYVQAPTGIGKTLSTLFPSVKAIGEGEAEKLFYLTAKTVTRGVAEDAVRRMHAKGARLKSLTIRAKEKICFCEEAVCNPVHCEYAKGHFDRVGDAVLEMLQQNDLITPDTIIEYSQKHRVCPYEAALDAALWADLVICDYNHVFDPVAYLRRFFANEGGDTNYVFLIDEAHNLADRVREMYTAALRKSDILRLRRDIQDKTKHSRRLHRALGAVNSRLLEIRKQADGKAESSAGSNAGSPSHSWAESDMDNELAEAVLRLVQAAEEWLAAEQHSGHPVYQNVLEMYFNTAAFAGVADRFDEAYARIVEVFGSDVVVTLYCLDPSRVIREKLGLAKSSTLFSATMTPLPYYRDLLGGSEGDYTLALPSPFDPARLQISIQAGISTKYAARQSSIEPVTEALLLATQTAPGNRIAFFPSYEYMQQVYRAFTEAHPAVPTLLQQSGMDEQARAEFLESFQARGGPLLGFCVLGGVFSEGIDLIGDRLIGAVVVGVGLPKITLRRNLIRDYYNGLGIDGFNYAYVYPGYNKVLQAAGRVIRTEEDSGGVLLIDSRYATGQYRNLLPAHWQNIAYVWDNKKLAERLGVRA